WTSTLLGGVSILMLGQIYFFFAQIAEKKNPLHLLTIAVLVLWLGGVAGSYMFAWDESISWFDFDRDPKLIIWAIKAAISLFLLLIVSFFMDKEFRKNIRNHPPLYYLFSACIWLGIAIFWKFDLTGGALDRIFLTTYIYGFFSLTLFGSLSFVLPIMANEKPKSSSSVKFSLVLLNAAAAVFVWDEYRVREGVNSESELSILLDLLGPFLWGLAGFLFVLYVFDLIYKSGVSPSLVAMLVALSMFGFFVVDTLMKNLFDQWVDRSHFHFMFIGTLLITIMAVGSRLLVMQYNPTSQEIDMKSNGEGEYEISTLIRTIGMGVTILGVVGVLTSFTLEEYLLAAYSGLVLLIGLVTVEITMIYQMRSKIKNLITS
ncbi:MAG: hypothetical protein ACW99Q_07145, partial [Candidatus Kariarchaeaceae archaeon]